MCDTIYLTTFEGHYMGLHIKPHDIKMVKHFFFELDSIDRWCDWENKKESFQDEYPEFMSSFDYYKTTKKDLTSCILGVDESYFDSKSNSKINKKDFKLMKHFFFEKDDISRWSQWEEKRVDFEKEFPMLVIAFDKYKSAKKTLSHRVDNLKLI